MTNYHLTIEDVTKIMTDNSNRSDPTKKDYTLSSEKEIENELSLFFDSQKCAECGHYHGFKNSFEDVRTSMYYLPAHLIHRISIAISIVERDNLAVKEVVIKK
jgi:hypothetical protein